MRAATKKDKVDQLSPLYACWSYTISGHAQLMSLLMCAMCRCERTTPDKLIKGVGEWRWCCLFNGCIRNECSTPTWPSAGRRLVHRELYTQIQPPSRIVVGSHDIFPHECYDVVSGGDVTVDVGFLLTTYRYYRYLYIIKSCEVLSL